MRVSFEGKGSIFTIWIDSFVCFSHSFSLILKEMVEVNQFAVKTANIHQSKIDMVKFNDTNNLGIWRYEVMDVLNTHNLEETLELQEKPTKSSEKDWKKMNQTACGVIRSSLT